MTNVTSRPATVALDLPGVRELAAADGHADRNRRPLLLGLDNAHLLSSTLLLWRAAV